MFVLRDADSVSCLFYDNWSGWVGVRRHECALMNEGVHATMHEQTKRTTISFELYFWVWQFVVLFLCRFELDMAFSC